MNYSPGGYNPSPENNGYNSGQNNNNGFNPSGNNYGYNNAAGRPPVKFSHFVPIEVWSRERNNIKRLSIMASGGVLAFILLSSVFVGAFQTLFMVLSGIDGAGFDYSSFQAKWNSAYFQYLFEIIYSIFIVGLPFFAIGYIFRKKRFVSEIPLGKPKEKKYLPIIIIGAFGFCVFGNIITAYIDVFFEFISGVQLELPDMPKTPRSVGGVLLFYLSTAVVPSLVEEMAFRGVVMQPLRRYGDWFAIICSSVMFGLMHCDLLQIPFAIFAGIAIGYAVIVTDSLWTGIIIHFLNNALAVTVSVITDFYGLESVAYFICNAFYYTIIAVGLSFCVWYVRKLQTYKFRKSPIVNQGKGFFGQPPFFSAKVSNKMLYKAYFINPTMIVSFIMVAIETIAVFMMY